MVGPSPASTLTQTPTTPRRRYPASLSHNPAGPSRPAPRPRTQSSIDDEVPPPPEPRELFSLEHLLQQAGYKETRVFTPQAERKRSTHEAELVDLYRSMGLDPNAPIHVRHLTKPSIPFRSSSSVLRNIALQDADSKNRSTVKSSADLKDASWWGSTLLGRAAETVGKSVSAMSPPTDSPEPIVGLGLAKGGNGVRKVVSNWELGKKDEWSGAPPPSLAGLFSPPPETLPRFDDDAFGEAQEDVFAYGESSVPSSLESQFSRRRIPSPPLLDADDVFADLGLTGPKADVRRQDIASVGRRVLASTIEYDDEHDIETPPSPCSPPITPVIPVLTLQEPSPEVVKREPKPRLSPRKVSPRKRPVARMATTPTKRRPRAVTPSSPSKAPSRAPASPTKPLRAAKSTPLLTTRRPPPLRITPATAAPPAVQKTSPVICDSQSSAAEDLPPLPIPPTPESPRAGGFSTLTLRARKSLSALKAYWAAEAAADAEPTPDVDDLPHNSTAPILTPRIDWEGQGFHAGWNTAEKLGHKTRDSTDTMAEFGDPFLEATADIDYTKSFFYKPSTPPRAGSAMTFKSRAEPRRQRSVKSLKAALRLPVAAPVPAIPDKFKRTSMSSSNASTLSRTPPLPIARLAMEAPAICVHSPGAFEEGRAATPLILEGEEWDGHDVVKNWGKGVRKGKGKTRVTSRGRMSYDFYNWA